ncbi:Glycosyltransferase involved in cell wall bisynthesis [Halogranum rubrum]|uniref:Glycosyltransferase involved in cell wall bisynthesis n=1 Tax=Halogranum rubrum TaxID=553466 RepID=A0A1I4BM54_9EURY|nr:glycosyltransferase family 4 protein [Halogranum rubrum]SFK69267.1 Glycosyltransferase involved in cell wall bisynthesis [Halogranum rubrum]
MAKVGVVQADLSRLGGGQVVCMNVIESLQREHEVEVLTASSVDIESLNEYADTSVEDVPVKKLGTIPQLVNKYRGRRFVLLEVALINRYVKSVREEYDVLISTVNELSLPGPAVQYVHVPQFDRSSVPGEEVDTTVYSLYNKVCKWLAQYREEDVTQSKLLANSNWTADVTENIYGIRPEVLYPPIDSQFRSAKPWNDREDGFVAVGRIEATKNYERLITIVDRLRERGYSTHLHIVGPADSDEYASHIKDLVEEREYILYEGKVPRERLFELLSGHKFGLHGKDYEHFGMAVAEMMLAGEIPFVPRSGGQQEIVNNDARLLYESEEEAVEKIAFVLEDPHEQESIRQGFPDAEQQFSRDRFKKRVEEIVREILEEQGQKTNSTVRY